MARRTFPKAIDCPDCREVAPRHCPGDAKRGRKENSRCNWYECRPCGQNIRIHWVAEPKQGVFSGIKEVLRVKQRVPWLPVS